MKNEKPLKIAVIGHKRILRLKAPVEATALRIVIDEARATPRLLPLAAHLARP